MLSSAGVKKLLIDPKMPKILGWRENCSRAQSFMMDQLWQYLKEVERGKLLTCIEPLWRWKLGRCSFSALTMTHWHHNRVEIVKWVSESMRPLSIVEDERFKMLMKTGSFNYKLLKQMTVAHDVNQVFKKTKKQMKKLLQVSRFIGN
jgi:hypothetical protein